MYTFKLQAVLDHRQYCEDNLKKELADIRKQVMTVREALAMLKIKETATAAALKEEQVSGLSSDEVVGYQHYFKRLSDGMTKQQTLLNTLEALESEKRVELRAAMKKRQVLEKLKDQGRERYHKEQLRKEMTFIDEIAVNQYVRKHIPNKDGVSQ